MFCSRCGNEIKGDGKFCPKCGAPIKPVQGAPNPGAGNGAAPGGTSQNYSYNQGNYSQGGYAQGGYGQAGMAAKKRPPYVAIGAIVLAVILVIVAVKLIFFRDNYEAPIKNLVKVMEEGNAEAALELIPEKYLDVAESWSGMDREDMEEMVIEQIEDAFDDYSGDIEIDYEIGNARDMTESELEDLESSYMGFLGDIEEGKEVEFSYKLYVNGAKQEESDPGETVRVLKIDGKWYLDPEEL